MKTIVKRSKTIIDIGDDEIIDMLKLRVRMYRRHLVSLDDLLGYMYAFENIHLITAEQFTSIVAYVCGQGSSFNPYE